jgi:hypothetical protein
MNERYDLFLQEALRQVVLLLMQDDWVIFEYQSKYDNEYDNPIVKQIMAME